MNHKEGSLLTVRCTHLLSNRSPTCQTKTKSLLSRIRQVLFIIFAIRLWFTIGFVKSWQTEMRNLYLESIMTDCTQKELTKMSGVWYFTSIGHIDRVNGKYLNQESLCECLINESLCWHHSDKCMHAPFLGGSRDTQNGTQHWREKLPPISIKFSSCSKVGNTSTFQPLASRKK